MEIVALNPQSGSHVVLATAEAPAFMALYPSDPPVICNTVVAVALDYRNEYFLYDWQSQRGFLLLVPRVKLQSSHPLTLHRLLSM